MMIVDFFKSLFSHEKPPGASWQPRQRDVMTLDAYAMDAEEEDETAGSCGTKRGGCGGCGCG